MKSGVPWSVKGIENKTRQAAKEAARRQGLTLGAWLNSVIIENAEGSATGQTRDAMMDFSRPPDDMPQGKDVSTRLDRLSKQLNELSQQQQSTAPVNWFDEVKQSEADNMPQLEELLARIQEGEIQTSANFDAMNDRLEIMGSRLDDVLKQGFPTKPQDVPGYPQLETALRNIVDHIEASETRTFEALKDIHLQLAEEGHPGSGKDDERITKQATLLSDIEERLNALAAKLDEPAERTKDLQNYVDESFSRLSEQVDSLKAESVAVAEQAETAAVQAAQEHANKLDMKFAGMLNQAHSTLGEIEQANAGLNQARAEIGTLNQRLESLGSQTADQTQIQQLTQNVEEISARLAQTSADMEPIRGLEHRLNELNARLQQYTDDTQAVERVNNLESSILAIDERLRQVAENTSDAEAIADLGHQLAAIGQRLETSEQHIGRLGAIETSIAQLFKSMEETQTNLSPTLREFATQSAEEAGRKYQERNAAEIQALTQGLEAIRQNAETADGQNRDTLEAVHETLEQIIEKLTELDDRLVAAESRPAAPVVEEAAPLSAPAHAAGQPMEPSLTGAPVATEVAAPPQPPAAQDWQQLIQTRLSSVTSHIASEPLVPGKPPAAAPAAAEPAPTAADAEVFNKYISAARNAADTTAIPLESEFDLDEDSAGKGIFGLFKSRKNTADTGDDDDKPPATRKRLLLSAILLLLAASAFSISNRSGDGEGSLLKLSSLFKQRPTAAEAQWQTHLPTRADEIITGSTSPARKENETKDLPEPAIPFNQAKDSTPLPSLLVPGASEEPSSNLQSNRVTSLAKQAPIAALPSPIAAVEEETAPPSTALDPIDENIGPEPLRRAALNGDSRAQFVVASRYLDTKTAQTDFDKAAYWYKKAADQKLAPAQYRLATLYERGKGVAKDVKTAADLYTLAAKNGNIRSMHNLAVLHSTGINGKPDYAEAIIWFNKASDYGLRDSQYNLAVLYERGLGAERDMEAAFFWYAVAGAYGDQDARARADVLKSSFDAETIAKVEARIKAWKPLRPPATGNIVAISDPSWHNGAPAGPKAAVSPQTELIGSELISTAQRLLSQLGFDIGPVDGKMGTRTANAIRLFQLQAGMAVNGNVSNELVRQLRLRTG